MKYEALLLERDARVATVILNRPEKRNALNTQLRDEIVAALDELDQDSAVSAVIIRANGPAFCCKSSA